MPIRYIGKTVWILAESKLQRIYFEGTLLKTHARQAPGARSTDHADYPPELTPHTLRDRERIIRQAEREGVQIGRFARSLL